MNAIIDNLAPLAAQKEVQTKSYDLWFRAQVEAALEDKRPTLSHQQVMKEVQALIDRKRRAQA